MPYVKLDAGILDSTLWLTDSDVRVVFITMLAMAKPDGLCEATAPGVARRANLSLEATRAAIEVLSAPDDDSRSLDMEGRRIVRVDGGFFIVNYEKYRQKDHRSTERSRRWRAKQRAEEAKSGTPSPTVPPSQIVPGTQAEAEAEAYIPSPDGEGVDGVPSTRCPHKEIIALYHKILPELRRVQEWGEFREQLLRARWRESKTRQDLAWWDWYFTWVRQSRFLMGDNDRGFTPDLEWLIRPQNMPKVIEGKYHNDRRRAAKGWIDRAAEAMGCNGDGGSDG